jgi:hypothetical protein
MSMEIYALSDKRLSTIAEWQRAIDTTGPKLILDSERPLARLKGFLPAIWQGRSAGFECDHWDSKDVIDGYPAVNFGRRWKYCLAFRWDADARACLGAYISAAAYANATAGVVFDPDAGKILTPQQAKQSAEQIEKDLPSFERTMQSIMGVIERTGRLPK